ncbi:MAG: thioesterase family protein [Nocardioidaceae bacterium]|nr:thioesterase family protein [Nocardioidaceae bacterium]MCL2612452.1 thioesterase family protein [Nocardioidaceae bacterium]
MSHAASSRPDGPEHPWTTPFPELLTLLEIAADGTDRFDAPHSRAAGVTGHVFGGLVAAQALVAAGRTVDTDRAAHSLHAYFLRPGDPTVPITLEVERSRDGRSFSHRRVMAVQRGRAIVEMSCSFATPRSGVRHHLGLPDAPPPDSQRPDHEVLAELRHGFSRYATSEDAFELRTVGMGPGWFEAKVPPEQPTLVWKRATGTAPADPLLRAALFTYASDMRILHPALRPHGRSMYAEDVRPATIDHAVWFHGPLPVDDWMLWRCESPWAADGRAFVRATVHTTAGDLVAEAAQEGLLALR